MNQVTGLQDRRMQRGAGRAVDDGRGRGFGQEPPERRTFMPGFVNPERGASPPFSAPSLDPFPSFGAPLPRAVVRAGRPSAWPEAFLSDPQAPCRLGLAGARARSPGHTSLFSIARAMLPVRSA